MSLLGILREKRDELKEQWLQAIFRTYPLDTVGFMRRQHDQFENPIYHRSKEAVNTLVDMLLEDDGLDTVAVKPWVEEIVRVRAVQDFTPARGVGVMFLIKGLVRKQLEKQLGDVALLRELLQFESKIDSLALISFDIYSQCKQELFELRVREVKNSQASLLRRARLVLDTSAEEPDPTNP